MSNRVQPNADYYLQFPDLHRGHGTIVERKGDLVKVQWDGLKQIDELHVDFLTAADGTFVPAVNRRHINRAKREAIKARRKQIRAAFDKIRYDPEQKTTANMLAGFLSGRVEITPEITKKVNEIIVQTAERD